MSKIIAIVNQKGGVGKTTTCVNIAAYIAAMGKRVLVCDIDPQGNASSGLGVEKNKLVHSIYDVLVGDAKTSQVLLPTTVKGLTIMPSHIKMAGVEVELVSLPKREYILRTILTPLKNSFEYIFIDCPPSLGLLTVNAITAADSVMIPIPGEFYALEGLGQLMNTIKLAKTHLNSGLEIDGVVFTMFDGRSNLATSVAQEVVKFFGKKVFLSRIPRNIKLGEAPSHGLPIMQFEPKSTGGIAYFELAKEFLIRSGDTNFRQIDDTGKLKMKG